MAILFNLLSFLVPLTFYSRTSELFEFNKIILLYVFTTLIMAYWAIKMIIAKKVIFKRTLLDIPLLFFLASQTLSTIISIDPRTSLLGYYSRFNGGLFSLASYSLLYWAYVSNIDRKQTLKLIRVTLVSGATVGIYGTLEHFGHSPSCLFISESFNTDCWVQDVQLRVFATLGQPNWLGAWMAALIPIAWTKGNRMQYSVYSILYTAVLLFTKSRSALLGFAVAFAIYWPLYLWLNKQKLKNALLHFSLTTFYILLTTLIIGSPWSPSISELVNKQKSVKLQVNNLEQAVVPTVQMGGTESGDIRKIVWSGAWELFKQYPIFGSGTETFGLAYYQTRPAEHNNVSEWNFLYNKAHNEYLNFLSTTGIIGFAAYMTLIIVMILSFLNYQLPIFRPKADQPGIGNYQSSPNNSMTKQKKWKLGNYKLNENWSLKIENFRLALLAGFASILVSNFFGFSVVPVSLLTFLFPAMAISLQDSRPKADQTGAGNIKYKNFDTQQKIGSLLILCAMFYALWTIGRYWYADTLYAKADAYNNSGQADKSSVYALRAIKITPNEAVYHDALAYAYFISAQVAYESGDPENGNAFASQMSAEIEKTYRLSNHNVKLIKSAANMYNNISNYNTGYLPASLKYLEILERLAPTDASVYYIKGLTMAKLGNKDEAKQLLAKTLELRPKYKNARLLYAILLAESGDKELAREQIEYVYTYISPEDKEATVVAEEYGL